MKGKIGVVASSEFQTAVRSKGFIIGVLMMPILVGVSILIQLVSSRQVDTSDRRVAVIDHTQKLYPVLEARTSERNAMLESVDAGNGAAESRRAGGLRGYAAEGGKIILSQVQVGALPIVDVRLELSDRIRRNEIFAFVEIEPDVFAATPDRTAKIIYHSDKPTYDEVRRWVDEILNAEIRRRRYDEAGIDQTLVSKLERRVETENRGLESRTETGEIKAAEEIDGVRTFAIPAILMFLLFMVVTSSTPQLLNGVLEEKMSRISEVMLGSVTPFELMMGKLLGSVGVSGILATLYLSGGFVVAHTYGYGNAIPYTLLVWFGLFLLLAVLLFGSIYVAIGAACTELKDAQSLMMPAMIIMMLPVFAWEPVMRHPDSVFSVAISLFPLATPMLMLLRLSIHPGPPIWQVVAALIITPLTTLLFVWGAGKIFRTGVLMQGKPASLREMLRWVMTKS